MSASLLSTALAKGALGTRLNRDEALALMTAADPAELHRLGAAAAANRRRRFGQRASYVFNLQINPSNICRGQCGFCLYHAKSAGSPNAYVLSEAEIFARVSQTEPDEVHIVGGMNELWPFARNSALVEQLRRRYPKLHIKAFTAVEIAFFAEQSGQSCAAVLSALKQAGLQGLPGGGAELFSRRMRKRYCPTKISAQQWLEIHAQAHALGLSTNATMLYGLDESAEERVDHLLMLQAAQDRSGGFSCFIPLAFQPGKGKSGGPSAAENLRLIAASRLILDNFPHIKAYWPMIGLETAAAALWFGADDLDGTLGQETIAHAAGAPTPKALTEQRMCETIRQGGFEPVRRDGQFNPFEPKVGARR